MVVIHPLAWELIPRNGLSSKLENYGWLVGISDKAGQPVIFFAWDCQDFKQQTIVAAEPDPKELHDLTVALPLGLGMIGMFHSHPHGSKIFHSHVDDNTVDDYINMVPNFLSVVTNGKDVVCYTVVDKRTKALREVKPRLIVPPRPPHTRFHVPVDMAIPRPDGQVQPHHVTSALVNALFQGWAGGRQYAGLKSLKKGKGFELPLVTLGDRAQGKRVDLEVRVPALLNAKTAKTLKDKALYLKGEVVVDLFHGKKATLAAVDERVRNAINDRLAQRVLKGRLDKRGKAWELAPVNRVRYFDVPLAFIFPVAEPRDACQRFLDKMLARFEFFAPRLVQKKPKVGRQVQATITDLEALASKYKLPGYKKPLAQWRKSLLP